ncbi:hypothetical protein V1525DRAFT_338367 [Lipomyces kononenkoae]|uniref:Uncharacterized protein n=1 Tax=Lipomyces kononenkoae TaxID=34357 RepID=A0ACC3T783_LIPKO
MTITSSGSVMVTPSSAPGTITTPTPTPPAPDTTYNPAQWLPSTLITEAPPTTPATTVTQPAPSSTTAGAGLPDVIAPSNGIPTIPPDSTLVQVGFTYALNYPFIVKNPLAVAQIFDYLPRGVSYGLNIDTNQTIMQSIQPYQTAGENFIVSMAMLYIPTDLVNTLLLGLHTPSSLFYNNPDPSVNSLMGLIDPTIPLIASTTGSGSTATPGESSSGVSSGSTGSGGNGSPSSDTGSSNGSTVLSGSLDTSGSPKTSSKKVIGIAVGAVAGVVLYGVLVFFLARKYRKRQQARAASPNMRQISPPMPYMATASSSPYSYTSPPGSGGGSGSGGGGAPGSSGGVVGYSPTSSAGRNNASRQSRISASHGSSSGGYVSARTQPISVPVMSENSLGWS